MHNKINEETKEGEGVDKASSDQAMVSNPTVQSTHRRFKVPSRLRDLLIPAVAVAASFVLPAVSALADAPPGGKSAEAHVCDNRILRGDYGFSFSGSFSTGESYTGVGSESCNDEGKCSGVTTISINGNASTAPFTSEYTINPDCTGTETASYYTLGLNVTEAVTVVDGGREVHFMGTDPGGTSIGVMKRRW